MMLPGAMCAPRSNREVRAIMARMHRPHQPGAAFHIVARTQGHYPLFVPELKREIHRLIIDGVASGGARLISHVVMDNHLHVVLFQGSSRLGWVMQPILRRTALLIQRHHGGEGHVFERRFRSKQCESTDHLRNCILYVHRNPVEARMCETPEAYAFSSARAYEGLEPCGNICVEEGLQLFGCSDSKRGLPRRRQYSEDVRRPLSGDVLEFFDHWLHRRRKHHALAITRWKDHDVRPSADIRDAALRILNAINPDVDVDVVRSRYGGPAIVSARTQLIASLLQRGYRGSCIADYLRISGATVSRVRSRMRWEVAKAG
jgi:REP element-mobilizing transposase RayT